MSCRRDVTTLDQCSYGAMMEGGLIKKSTDILSEKGVPELAGHCSGDHSHVQLRGTSREGSRTALSAVYPDDLCDAILRATRRISTTASGGRICINSHKEIPGNNENEQRPKDEHYCRSTFRTTDSCKPARSIASLGYDRHSVASTAPTAEA